MRILLLYNPIAGRGRGKECADGLRRELGDEGHDVSVHETQLAPVETWLDPLLIAPNGAELLVVVGGDGAVRMASPAAARTGTLLYQCPLGTENLFSREFGMDRSATRLLQAIAGGRVAHVDMASVETAPGAAYRFLLMLSIGFDAEVIRDLATRRTGRITHLSYAGPIIRQLARWSPPCLSIEVDGTPVVDSESGFVVVANSRQYARRFDPVPCADMTDGLLDVAFFPAASRRALLAWAARCARHTQLDHPALVYRTARDVKIACDPPRCLQLDGDRPDPPGDAGAGDGTVGQMTISIEPGVLPVLLP